MNRRYSQNPEAAEREVDSAIFLVIKGNDTVHHLNQTGAAIWRLMSQPTSVTEAVDIIHQAFPDVAIKRIETDVGTIIKDLADGGFIIADD